MIDSEGTDLGVKLPIVQAEAQRTQLDARVPIAGLSIGHETTQMPSGEQEQRRLGTRPRGRRENDPPGEQNGVPVQQRAGPAGDGHIVQPSGEVPEVVQVHPYPFTVVVVSSTTMPNGNLPDDEIEFQALTFLCQHMGLLRHNAEAGHWAIRLNRIVEQVRAGGSARQACVLLGLTGAAPGTTRSPGDPWPLGLRPAEPPLGGGAYVCPLRRCARTDTRGDDASPPSCLVFDEPMQPA
ncbi:hypothetical protein ABZ403_03055 [Micromonospora zamorensis]|uniref:hypothetical protein n=1 Tax=Micromonospora zamorensis TaxID=709883 RepID=UPI00340AC56F